jgi:plastocyanin
MEKKLKIIGLAAALLIIAGLLVWMYVQKDSIMSPEGDQVPKIDNNYTLSDLDEEAAEATNALINDALELGSAETISIPGAPGEPVEGEDGLIEAQEIKIVKVSPGTNGIDVQTGRVVNDQGVVIDTSVDPSGPGAPAPSFPLTQEQIPNSAIRLEATSYGFTPSEFTVSRGQAINLVITNVNESTYAEIFRFDDPSLQAVVLGVAKGETNSITFNAPTTAGEYTFYSSMFNHRDLGAVGKMIVR